MALHALDGIRVVEVAEWFFMPSCGTVLADWGLHLIDVQEALGNLVDLVPQESAAYLKAAAKTR